MKRFTQKTAAMLLAMVLAFSLLLGAAFAAADPAAQPAAEKKAKNVIIMISDGTGVTATTLARWYRGGTPLALDEIASGLVRTYWAAGAISDSAPAATALATGYKSSNKFIGVTAEENNMPGLAPIKDEDKKRPVATILEAAKSAGKATGLVATSEITHATPASFSSHYPNRAEEEILGEQIVYNNIDVILSAGTDFLAGNKRDDKEDLIQVIKDKGYDYVTAPADMQMSTSAKLWGFFDPKSLAYDFDRDPQKEPSLAEMTKKAIDVLSKDKDGFFLMVEGSKIDWASHANDPIGVISDTLAYDAAVKVALDFAKKDGNTMLVACADHGNGGITIGDTSTNSTYDDVPLSYFMDQIKKAKLTGEGVEKLIKKDKSNIREVFEQYYGISDLTDQEVAAITKVKNNLIKTVGAMFSKRAHIGWTTTGHTGEDVVLYSYLPNNERINGVIENTDIPKLAAKFLGVNLDETTKKLFVPARAAFEAKGAKVEWDITDLNNPVIVVTKGSDVLKLPVYKNIASLNGKIIELPGVNAYNGERCYVSQQAIDLIK